MAKKINMVAVKEFLLKHGEKVALGSCAFIAITFGILGLWRAGSAGRADGTPLGNVSWPEAFNTVKKRIEQERDSIQPVKMDEATEKKLLPDNYDWNPQQLVYNPVPYIVNPDTTHGNKRQNPLALAAIADPKLMSLEFINGGIFVHNYNPANKTVDGLGGPEGEVPMGGVPMPQPKGGAGVQTALPPYANYVRPSRMVIGTMVFPLKKLVADYVKALRLESQADLFASRDDLPQFEGFNLIRFEILPNGEFANQNGELVIAYDSKAKQVKASPGLKKMLREAIYDDHLPANLEPYIFAGLSMPMPKLANRYYQKPNIPGIDLSGWSDEMMPLKKGFPGGEKMPGPGPGPGGKEGKGGIVLPGGGKKGRPMGPGRDPMEPMGGPGKVAGPERKIIQIPYKDLVKGDPHLANRLFNKDFEKDFNYFHVFGFKPPVVPIEGKGMPGGGGGRVPGGEMGGGGPGALNDGRYFSAWDVPVGDEALPEGGVPMPGGPGKKFAGGEQGPGGIAGGAGAEFKNWDRDALIRFIDVDVEPGKVYQYALQVRIANPNYKKNNLVAFNALAAAPELPLNGNFVWTPAIAIPQEYHLFAVDQQLFDEWAGEKVGKIIVPKDAAHIQVHQWVKYKDDRGLGSKHVIADWAIAERLLVKRGEEIGLGVTVQVPVWRETKDSFEIPMEIKDAKKPKEVKPGLKLDLRPHIVEKDGKESALQPPVLVDFSGGRKYKSSGAVDEESALTALIIDSNGKLIVRNSRIDSDAAFPMARERQERVIGARQRVTDLSNDRPGVPKGPMLPGGGVGGGS